MEKTEVSKLSAHSTLSRELVDFMEYDFAYIIEAVYNLLGSLVLLYFYDTAVVATCFTILLPVIIISYFYGKKMRRLTTLKNDELEKQVNIILEGKPEYIRKHYNKLRKWQIKISDKEAFNFGLIEIMVMLVIGASLLISHNRLGTTLLAGNLIGIYNYILKFVSGLDTIPYTVQRLTSLNDITRRIKLQDDDFEKKTETVKPRKFHLKSRLKISA